MDVIYSFLCDYADNTTGKLHALGIGIDTVYAQTLPARHRHLFAVIALRFSRVEAGEKRLSLHVVDADGADILPSVDTALNVGPPPPGYAYRVERAALGMYNVGFAKYGDYSFRWVVNGTEAASIPLKVVPPPGLASSEGGKA